MHGCPARRALADGAERAEGAFRVRPAVGGVKLAKTYTFKRGDYVIDVQHEVRQQRRRADAPQLYLQLVRDGNPPRGESSFYFTFTGPAIYTEAKKFKKIDFKDIEKRGGRKPDHATSANDGWVAMVQHYFASAWLLPASRRRASSSPPRSTTNLYSVAMLVPLGEIAPGATKTFDAHPVRRPAGREQARHAGARARAGQGLRLVHDPRQAAVLAADATAQGARQLGLVDRRRWWCC